MSTDIAVRAHGALTITPDQTWWTDEQSLVLRQAGIDDEVTEAELRGFLHLCQRTELDPFSRQIYLIGRWDRRAGRKVFTPQTAIDGYRVVRDRVVERTSGSLSYDDFVWCGPDGEWRDVWVDDTTPPVAAKVTVYRNGGKFSAVAKFSEYAQTDKDGKRIGLWARMPAGQLAKCAEALALRKAFPHDLAGVYTAEEMAQADNAATEQRQQSARLAEDDPWQVHPPTQQPAATPEYAEIIEQPAPVVHLVPDLAKALRLVRGAESDEAQYRALSQILGREVAVGELVPSEDVGRALEALRGEYRQNAKQRQQDAREAARAADRDAVPPAAGPTPDDPEATKGRQRMMHALFREKGIGDDGKHPFIARVLGHDIETMAKITKSQCDAVIAALNTGEIPAPSAEFDEFAALAQMVSAVHNEKSFVAAQQEIDAEAAAGRISAEDRDLLRERLAEVSAKLPVGVAS